MTEDIHRAPSVTGFLRDRNSHPAEHWRELYSGAACFLVCGGPSLNSLDLTKLNRRGVLIAAVNQCAATHVRPHLWFSGDSPSHFHQAIWKDPAVAKFCKVDKATLPTAERFGDRWRQTGPAAWEFPNTWFYRWVTGWDAQTFFSRSKVLWGGEGELPNGDKRITKSVMLPAVRLLFWMGVRTLFIVGADFHMQPVGSYAFDDEKDATASGYNNNSYHILNGWFRELQPVALRYGLRVFNANPESRLDGFPRISYDTAIEMATEGFPSVATVKGHYRA